MIGLGSNRLTVCRRGGMSVTQAGRGGMEWLAGTGARSPYSVQATAALKAAFPTQWPTIRDYGFAPMTIEFKKNCNYLGGNLDGHEWTEVATSGTWSGSNVQVTVNAYQKPGTFCRINGTDCGIVTAVLDNGDDTYTLTLGCLCGLVAAGTTITKVELYKPV